MTEKPDLSNEDLDDRTRGQVEEIVRALGSENVAWYSGPDNDDPAYFEYLYQPGRILVREADVELVLRHLRAVSSDQEGAARSDQEGAVRGEQDRPGRNENGVINGLTMLNLPDGLSVPDALDRLDRDLGVGIATPNHILWISSSGSCCPATEPEPPEVPSPVPAVSVDEHSGAGVFVSVVDTGLDLDLAATTPWLAGVQGDPEDNSAQPLRVYAGHGTFIAGIVRALAPAAEVRVDGFLPNGGAVHETEIVKQLVDTLAFGPDIISLSAGTRTRNQLPVLGFEVFWRNHLRHVKGTVLVAAAGNDNTRIPFWPAAYPWTISVGAMDAMRQRAWFSNFGSWVDLYAPGVDVVNAYPYGRYVYHEPPHKGRRRTFKGLAQWSGTSFATPIVAGIIAARMSHTGESARAAADALVARARAQALPGLGAFLEPGPHNNAH